MNVYIVIGSNEEESYKEVIKCFRSEKNAEKFCSVCNEMFSGTRVSFYMICRNIVDYDW